MADINSHIPLAATQSPGLHLTTRKARDGAVQILRKKAGVREHLESMLQHLTVFCDAKSWPKRGLNLSFVKCEFTLGISFSGHSSIYMCVLGGGGIQHHQAVKSALTLFAWRCHQIPQVQGSVLQDHPTSFTSDAS